jgi:predicted aldo/keto reductase-like oxidoreductase
MGSPKEIRRRGPEGRAVALGRRRFLGQSAAAVLGAGIAAGASRVFGQETQASAKIKEYRLLGRTGFRVSDIAAGYIQDEGVLRAALDGGMNYIDTAEQYPGHHRIVAKALQGLDRKSIFVTTKLQVLEDKSREGFLKRARKCLQDLETDHIDCLMMHMPENIETLKTEGFHQAMAELKTEGRVRFVGLSNHGSFWFRDPEETMEKVLLAAAEDGRFDVFLMAYNFLKMDEAERVLAVCREKKIGAAIMKSTPVAIYYNLKSRIEQLEKEKKEVHPLYTEGLKRYKDKFDRAEEFIRRYNLQNQAEIQKAAVRFVLGNPNVSTVCSVPGTYEELERFLLLSGTRLSDTEEEKLAAYREGCGELYCRHACGICEPACPSGVPVNTIMRFYQYYAGRGREREAMVSYAGIPGSRAEACAGCAGHCEAACPYHVPVQGMLLLAHSELAAP